MMRLRAFGLPVGLGLAALLALAAPPATAQTPQARPLLEELYRARLDPALSFRVNDLSLRRDAIRLNFEHGTLMFFAPVAGRMTGAVFEGTGQVLVVPPLRAERHQLSKFTGSPILAETFSSAYLRFTDESFAELMAQIRGGRGRATHAPEVAEHWQPLIEPANRVHSVRILLDFLQSPPLPYFYAGIQGERLGPFDVIVDDRRAEPVLVGQLQSREEQRYYNVWASFPRREAAPQAAGARAEHFRIHAVIHPDRNLEAEAEVEIQVTPPGRQLLIFNLSRRLRVEEVMQLQPDSPQAPARPLEFIQDVTLSAEEAAYRATDFVLVLLPSGDPSGGTKARRLLRFRYHGSIIGEAGTGVMFVTARDTWYPSLEQTTPARFDLHFRYPRALELAAGGRRLEHREDGEWKECRYQASVPLPLAGFNVGEYETRTYGEEPAQVRVHANRRLETRLARSLGQLPELQAGPQPREAPLAGLVGSAPTLELDRVGSEVTAAFNYFTERFGPVPYGTLEVSPLPGRLAQGYPGLLYLSTLSYLSEADLERLGVPPASRTHLRLLMPAHETAHQWWGNWVWTSGYRDQWINEALSSYSALLMAEHRRGPGADEQVLRSWLESYRAGLLQADEDGRPAEATGALSLGQRLNSSQSPNGYVTVVYNKGPWVIHMLRELLRDSETGSDERFFEVLRRVVARGGSEPLTTEELQRAFEALLPPAADVENTGRLDWFFDQWVHDTGIPRYRLDWRLAGDASQGWQVEGSIEQSEVSDLFTMPVPVYARNGAAWSRLGTVVVTGTRVSFRLAAAARPDEVALDPLGTVLFVSAERDAP